LVENCLANAQQRIFGKTKASLNIVLSLSFPFVSEDLFFNF